MLSCGNQCRALSGYHNGKMKVTRVGIGPTTYLQSDMNKFISLKVILCNYYDHTPLHNDGMNSIVNYLIILKILKFFLSFML